MLSACLVASNANALHCTQPDYHLNLISVLADEGALVFDHQMADYGGRSRRLNVRPTTYVTGGWWPGSFQAILKLSDSTFNALGSSKVRGPGKGLAWRVVMRARTKPLAA